MKYIYPFLAIIFFSCTKTYMQSSSDSATVEITPKVLYFDQFQRPDVTGDLGMPQIGVKYDMLGGGISMGTPVSSSIKDHRWVSPNCNDVYAIQTLPEGTRINYANVTFRWEPNNGKYGDGIFVVLMGELGGENIAYNCEHFRINRIGIGFDVFENGRSTNLNFIPFPEYLEIGKDYTFVFMVVGDTVYYSINGSTFDYVADPRYANKIGRTITLEHFYNSHEYSNTISVMKAGAGTTL